MTPPTSLSSWVGMLTAVVLVAFFGWLTWGMFVVRVSEPAEIWSRSMVIYSAIEAFALSAAGALMGVQIQGGRVRAAETRADAKAQEADAARRDAVQAQSELGGYRQVVHQARARLAGPSEAGGAEAGEASPGRSDIEVARSLLESLE
jgi:hypothetical protein